MRRVDGDSAAFLAKEIVPDAPPVATSSIGLGFRSFSPITSQSVPPANRSVFLSEDDLPPSNQLEVQQIVVSDTMLPGPSGAMHLPEVTLPLTTLQVNTASNIKTILLWEPRHSRYHCGVVGPITTRRWCTVAVPSSTACICLARTTITVERTESWRWSAGWARRICRKCVFLPSDQCSYGV